MQNKLFINIKNKLIGNTVILNNFTYISLLQLVYLIAPLITYPYLIRVLGKELYGFVLTAQVVASYCSLVIRFGFDRVSAKHISINRNNKDKLSEILSSILCVRLLLWLISLLVYLVIIFSVHTYRDHFLLFILSFGITFNELLFPQFFFQGIEKMKYTSIINIAIRVLFILLAFIFVKRPEDYYIVPLLLSIGYFLGGTISLYLIIMKEKVILKKPQFLSMRFYTRDAFSIFTTDIISSIKDKFNYFLIGAYVGMGDVVIYDLGSKFMNMLIKPSIVIGTVTFPKIAKERKVILFKKIAVISFIITLILVLILFFFLPGIVSFFIPGEIDLNPIKLYLLAPLFLSVGAIASNFLIALGYNKYIFYSILVTTSVYLFLLIFCYSGGLLNNVTTFVMITVFSYLTELIYRILIMKKISNT